MTPTTETWLPVAGYEGQYEVSDLGNVHSLNRTVVDRTGRVNRFPGRPIKSHVSSSNGRRMVQLSAGGKRRLRTIYPMVLEAFVGPRPPGMEACHNNGDALNDCLDNLRWDTPSENGRDTVRHGHHVGAAKETCPYAHPLELPNLVPSGRGRQCLACSRARANIRHARSLGAVPDDHQSLSDWHYARIVQRAKE